MGFCATSVPRLGLKLEVDHLELAVLVRRFGSGKQLDVGEIHGEAETPSQLRDIVAVAGEALDFDDAIRLGEAREPEPLGIPRGVEHRGRVVAPELRQEIGIDAGAAPFGHDAGQLEQHRGRPRARLLQLGNGFFAGAQHFELRFDFAMIRYRLFDLLDLPPELGVGAHLRGELVAFHLMKEDEADDLDHHRTEDDEKPTLVGLCGALDLALLGQKVDANQERFSLSLRMARPSATASCALTLESMAGSMAVVSTAIFSSGEKTSTATRARRSMAWGKSGRRAVPPIK